jgi:hypothetical protein
MAVEHSRAVLLGAGASGRAESELEAALEASRVIVSLDPDLPAAPLTARVLLTTLRRLPGQLVLDRQGLPRALVDELTSAVTTVDPSRPLRLERPTGATVHLHIGSDRADHAIRLVPDGHGAHIAGQRTAAVRVARPASALGAIYTAALGAAEAFKHAATILPARRVLHRHLRFCPVSLSSNLTAVPMLEQSLELDLTLVGIGAIGTAVMLILDALGAHGRLVAVDYQDFAPENRGTYSIGGAAEMTAKPPKVELAAAALPRFEVVRFPNEVEKLPDAIDAGAIPWTPLVIAGLDSAPARRSTQHLWPDRLIDAATGDTMLGIHDHTYGAGPCMRCFFPEDRTGPSAAERLAELTGLSVRRAQRGQEPLTEHDLEGLDDEHRARLAHYFGKPVCGLAQAFGLSAVDASGYQPAVPFVSLQAAALAIGRVIADSTKRSSPANLVQYDALFGPQTATLEQMLVTPDCYCQTRSATIERVRAKRAAKDQPTRRERAMSLRPGTPNTAGAEGVPLTV